VRGPALEVALAAACAGVADAEELSALVRRQAAELAVLEAQQTSRGPLPPPQGLRPRRRR
jgi:hypothetical protein